MAITVNVQPDGTAGITPAHNDIIFIVTSTNYAQTNFKFVCVVKDGSGTQIAKLKQPIWNGSTSKAVFNLKRILENYVSHNLTRTQSTPIARCTDSYIDYSVEFGEEYGSTPTEYLNLTSVTGQQAWNAVFSAHDFITFSFSDWVMTDTSKKFLTNARSKRVTSTQYDYLYFFSKAYGGSPTPITRVKVTGYSAAGSVLVQFDILNTFTSTATNNRMLRCVAGPGQLDLLSGGDILMGTTGSGTEGVNLLTGNASLAYYTLQCRNNTGYCGEEMHFDIRTDCSKYGGRQLFWLNRMGGFDSWVFNGKETILQTANRKQFTKNHNAYATTPSYGYSHQSRGISNYHTEYRRKYTLNSGLLNEVEAVVFAELMTSPQVFMLDDDSHLLAVNVLNDTYTVQKYVNDKVLMFSVDVEEAVGSFAQNL